MFTFETGNLGLQLCYLGRGGEERGVRWEERGVRREGRGRGGEGSRRK